MHEFKYMSDNFPKLPEVPLHPNDYDYTSWDGGTATLKLLNVPWDMDYKNVVEFESESERNAYFAGIEGYSIELPDGFRNQMNEYIKVPIPFNNACIYNYAMITYPIPPNASKPLDYATHEPAKRTMLYFITDMLETAPNTTRLMLEPDIWQMWRYTVEFKNLQLERGHYGISQGADIETYLSSPINHTTWLLDSEPFADLPGQMQDGSTFVPINTSNSTMYAVFSLPFAITGLQDLSLYQDKPYSSDSVPTYTDYDNTVIGKDAKINNLMYNVPRHEVYNSIIPNSNPDSSFNNAQVKYYYGIPLIDLITSLNNLKANYKYILNNITKIYLISNDYFTVQQIPDILLFYKIQFKQKEIYVNIDDLLAEYKQRVLYTKELTYPYLKIKLSNADGATYEIKTQDCYADFSILNNIIFNNDALTLRSNICGINAGNNFALTVKTLNSTLAQKMFKNDLSYEMYTHFNIPTFAVYIQAQEWDKYQNAGDRLINQYSLENSYTRDVMGLNCAEDNAIITAGTTQTNTFNTADTALNNSLASNEVTKNTGDASASTANSTAKAANATAEGNVNRTNSAVSDNATARQGANSAITAQNVLYNNGMNTINISRNMTTTQAQNGLQATLTGTAVNASVAQAVTGAINSLASADIAGAVLGGVSTAISVGAETAKSNAIIGNNTDMYNASTVFDSASTNESNSFINDKTTLENTFIATSTANNVYASNTNASDTRVTADNNADAILNTSLANNANVKSYNDAIATATNTAQRANATRSYNNSVTVATDNRETGLTQEQINALYTYNINGAGIVKASYEQVPYISEYSYSDVSQMFGDGWLVLVEGLKEDTKQSIEDYWSRYGYSAGNKIIPADSLQVMPYFTYVKAHDVIVVPNACNAKNALILKNILINGTTVYSNPEDIGQYLIQTGA